MVDRDACVPGEHGADTPGDDTVMEHAPAGAAPKRRHAAFLASREHDATDGTQAQIGADASGKDGGGVWPFLGLPFPG